MRRQDKEEEEKEASIMILYFGCLTLKLEKILVNEEKC